MKSTKKKRRRRHSRESRGVNGCVWVREKKTTRFLICIYQRRRGEGGGAEKIDRLPTLEEISTVYK